ncbi:MAG: HEAT repeat domain-containing protein [Acidobacteria bacterium]|nr:HEAT repeat domain-containing protein [Acidobacteriota bacterium]
MMPSDKGPLSNSDPNRDEPISPVSLPDPKELKAVQTILSFTEKTFNQLKIFPFRHDNVLNFFRRTHSEITAFLRNHPQIDLEIKETAFTYKDEIVLSEPDIKKSIPFLLFKDGMQSLVFSIGLQEKELEDFFLILHECSQLPPEESDTVYSIWEKNFAHIHHTATDLMLLMRVKSEVQPYEPDPADMFMGSVNWEEGDGSQEGKKDPPPGDLDHQEENPENKLQRESEQLTKKSALSKEEQSTLQRMILASRKINPDDELTALYLEILYMAENEEGFTTSINSIAEHLRSIIKKNDFAGAAYLVGSIREMEHEYIHQNPARLPPLQGCIKSLSDPLFLDHVRKTVTSDPVSAQNDEFLLLLNFLGPASFSLIRDLYNAKKSDAFYLKAYHFFLKALQSDPSSLLMQLSIGEDDISRAVITALGDSRLPKTVETLSCLLRNKNYIYLEDVIHALGKIDHVDAVRAILSLIGDSRPNIRFAALKNIVFHNSPSLQKDLEAHIRYPGFQTRSPKEKILLLRLLGKFNNERASTLIGRFIRKPGWIHRKKNLELALISISVLEKMTIPVAKRELERKRKLKNNKIRRACRKATAAETGQPVLKD